MKAASFWEDLGRVTWTRRKWRRTDGTPETEQCCACHLSIHRKSTYYLRPAYTDGSRWLCGRCYKQVVRERGEKPDNQYRRYRQDSHQEE